MHPNRATAVPFKHVVPRSFVLTTHSVAVCEMTDPVLVSIDDDGPGDLVAAVLILKHLAELLPMCEGVRVMVFLSVSSEISQRAVQATTLSHAFFGTTLCASLNSVHPRKHGNLTGFLYRSNGWSLENT